MIAYRYPNYVTAALRGGGAGVNPSYARSLFGLGDGFVTDLINGAPVNYYSSDETVTAPADWGAAAIDISEPQLIAAPSSGVNPASTPFDLGSTVSTVLNFLRGGSAVPSQQAALLAAQQAQAARAGSDVGTWIALGATALLVGGVIYAVVK